MMRQHAEDNVSCYPSHRSMTCLYKGSINRCGAGNTQKPLFCADCEIYQLINIFEMLGLPNEDTWPGVTKLLYWHEYPEFEPGKLNRTMEDRMNGDNHALDLLRKMLHGDPSQRIHVSLKKWKTEKSKNLLNHLR
ncbi:hypothetical protein BSKO_05879 [Bryopsis sp. KO-2023]|nr:hypothetical protein BSKO_05879 [Bryopsis sp. KO-2023]